MEPPPIHLLMQGGDGNNCAATLKSKMVGFRKHHSQIRTLTHLTVLFVWCSPLECICGCDNNPPLACICGCGKAHLYCMLIWDSSHCSSCCCRRCHHCRCCCCSLFSCLHVHAKISDHACVCAHVCVLCVRVRVCVRVCCVVCVACCFRRHRLLRLLLLLLG